MPEKQYYPIDTRTFDKQEPPPNDILQKWLQSPMKENWAKIIFENALGNLAFKGKNRTSLKQDFDEVGLTLQFDRYEEKEADGKLFGFSYAIVKENNTPLHTIMVEMHTGKIFVDGVHTGNFGSTGDEQLYFVAVSVLNEEYKRIVESL